MENEKTSGLENVSAQHLWFKIQVLVEDIEQDEEVTDACRYRILNDSITNFMEKLGHRVEEFNEEEEKAFKAAADRKEYSEDEEEDEEGEQDEDSSDSELSSDAALRIGKAFRLHSDLKFFLNDLATRYHKFKNEFAEKKFQETENEALEKYKSDLELKKVECRRAFITFWILTVLFGISVLTCHFSTKERE
jgi:DNA-directed RNA polymerase subunit N (RpoN/RPB10)